MQDFNPHYYARDLVRAAGAENIDQDDIALMFRRLFFQVDPQLGPKVLFILLTWLGEYDMSDPDDPDRRVPPLDNNELQRWAQKRETANLIKAALYADLSQPTSIKENTNG